jgi:transposase
MVMFEDGCQMRTGWYRQVRVKSLDSHLIRTLLAARAGLVAMHRDVANQIRGALKTFGLVLGKVAAGAFDARVRQLIAGHLGYSGLNMAEYAHHGFLLKGQRKELFAINGARGGSHGTVAEKSVPVANRTGTTQRA